jgi:hypothetical protein
MTVKVWVVSSASGLSDPSTEVDAETPAEAIFLAHAYRERFKDTGIVRIHPESDVSSEDLNSLREMAKLKGLHLTDFLP